MASSSVELSQSKWLILGGCGFIGQNLLRFLHENNLAEHITVADMKPPGRCSMSPELEQLFENKTITFIHSDCAQYPHVERLFNNTQYDFILDLINESRTGFSAEQIHTKMTKSFTNVIDHILTKLSYKPFFIEVSTAQIYDPNGKPANEQSNIKPWTIAAKAKWVCEQYLQEKIKSDGLRACILRPSIVYGPGDIQSISPRLCCAAVYQYTKEEMEFLWTKNLAINTVHVTDVCRAITWVAQYNNHCCHKIYNLSDAGNTTQGVVNIAIEKIFHIKTGFVGTILSNLAKLRLEEATQQSNEYHQPLWLQLARESGIPNTPLTTYLRSELLFNNPLTVDGTLITKDTITNKLSQQETFSYSHPKLTPKLLYEALQYGINNNLWPNKVTIYNPDN